MKRIRLRSIGDPLFTAAWALYENSFPADERRSAEYQSRTMQCERYHADAVVADSGAFVGILFWWQFDAVRYGEHLATLPSMRGEGIGASIVRDFLAESPQSVVLEVELPTDEMSRRRIGFYERLGLRLCDVPYFQPPYSRGASAVPMLVMSYPEVMDADEVADFVSRYHPIIYFER